MNFRSNKTTLLKPIDSKGKIVTFRTIIKCRNGDINTLEKNTNQLSQTQLQSLKHSRYSSTGALDHSNEAQSPIKHYAKEHITKKPLPNIPVSQSSQHSKKETDQLSESHLINSQKLEESLLKNQETKTFINLEELKKKVQHLLELNLQRCRLIQGKGEIAVWIQEKKACEVEEELLFLEQNLKKLKDEDQNLTQIATRLQLIETALVGQVVQSEALKKSYYNKKNNFYNTSSFVSKHALKESLKLNTTKYNPSLLTFQEKAKKDILKCTSTSKDFYKAPKRQDYVFPVKNIRKYEHNRYKLPMTSYEKEFLNYQSFPTFPKQLPSSVGLPNTTLTIKTSTYQNHFEDKNHSVKIIDYRDLDCARNKIKNIDISFMETSRKPKNAISSLKTKLTSKENTPISTPQYSLSHHSSEKIYLTEQKRNFKHLNDLSNQVYRSVPKNKQFLKLKENFRLLAQAL